MSTTITTIHVDVSGASAPILRAEIGTDAETGAPELVIDFGSDDWDTVPSAELRRRTATVRAHLDELDALADRYDAITAASE